MTCALGRFSFECRKSKTKTKTIIGFGFASDWLSRWAGARFLNQSQNVVKQNQFRITFDTQLKIALSHVTTSSAINDLLLTVIVFEAFKGWP